MKYAGLQDSPEAALQEVPPLVFISNAQVFFILQQLSPRKQTGHDVSFLSLLVRVVGVSSEIRTATSSVRPRALRSRRSTQAE